MNGTEQKIRDQTTDKTMAKPVTVVKNQEKRILSNLKQGNVIAGVKKYRVPKIERPSAHIILCKMIRYAPVVFVKVTL